MAVAARERLDAESMREQRNANAAMVVSQFKTCDVVRGATTHAIQLLLVYTYRQKDVPKEPTKL
jgi:hypothetical protein